MSFRPHVCRQGCAWVEHGALTIAFWDFNSRRMRSTTQDNTMRLCWEGGLFTLRNTTFKRDNRTVTVASKTLPQVSASHSEILRIL